MKNLSDCLKLPVLSGIPFFTLLLFVAGCKKHDVDFPTKNYEQVNLVADISSFNATRVDPFLVNAWGIAVSPNGRIWIAANHSSSSLVYDKTGATIIPPVLVPGTNAKTPGAPTGIIFNPTNDFKIKSTGQSSKFIFAGEDGIISAWGGGTSAIVVANRSAFDAVYKGLALDSDYQGNFLYAANFKQSRIDVFDADFNYVTNKPFKDPRIPADYGPFNIRQIHGLLFVTYAKHKGPDNEDDEAGPGNGFIDIYSPEGILLKRFSSGGALNSPWGIVEAKSGFCHTEESILVGNFGDGRINVYDKWGKFEGPLKKAGSNQPIAIEGLWALENNVAGADPGQLFFTAGPGDEEHGLFGYISRK